MPLFFNVSLTTEGEYLDYGVCKFDIDANVQIHKYLYGDDADGNRGVDVYDYELKDAVVFVSVFDDNGEVIKVIEDTEDSLSNEIVDALINKAKNFL